MALSIDTSTLMKLQQQMAAEEGQNSSAAVSKTKETSATREGPWRVPQWEAGFDLAPALQRAYIGAGTHMNRLLAADDLYVDLQPQGDDVIGQVRDGQDGRVVKTYAGLDILRLYSHNIRPRGVIVDGAL